MALPQSRTEFMDHCLRKLGAPVIDVNLDEEQVSDRINEALSFFQQYHFEAMQNEVIVYEVTQTDIDNGYIEFPSGILSVTHMARETNNMFSGQFMNNIWHGMKNIMYDIGFGMGACSGGLTNFGMTMQNLAEYRFAFSIIPTTEFQYHTHRLSMQTDMSLMLGEPVLFEVYRAIDPDTFPDVWTDRWLINYTTALMGEQWGVNLSKFDNVELPGGLTLDGDKIYDRYHEIRIDIEEKMQESFEEPPIMIMG